MGQAPRQGAEATLWPNTETKSDQVNVVQYSDQKRKIKMPQNQIPAQPWLFRFVIHTAMAAMLLTSVQYVKAQDSSKPVNTKEADVEHSLTGRWILKAVTLDGKRTQGAEPWLPNNPDSGWFNRSDNRLFLESDSRLFIEDTELVHQTGPLVVTRRKETLKIDRTQDPWTYTSKIIGTGSVTLKGNVLLLHDAELGEQVFDVLEFWNLSIRDDLPDYGDLSDQYEELRERFNRLVGKGLGNVEHQLLEKLNLIANQMRKIEVVHNLKCEVTSLAIRSRLARESGDVELAELLEKARQRKQRELESKKASEEAAEVDLQMSEPALVAEAAPNEQKTGASGQNFPPGEHPFDGHWKLKTVINVDGQDAKDAFSMAFDIPFEQYRSSLSIRNRKMFDESEGTSEGDEYRVERDGNRYLILSEDDGDSQQKNSLGTVYRLNNVLVLVGMTGSPFTFEFWRVNPERSKLLQDLSERHTALAELRLNGRDNEVAIAMKQIEEANDRLERFDQSYEIESLTLRALLARTEGDHKAAKDFEDRAKEIQRAQTGGANSNNELDGEPIVSRMHSLNGNRKSSAASTQVVEAGLAANLRQQISDAEIEYQMMSKSLGNGHPKLVSLKQRIELFNEQLLKISPNGDQRSQQQLDPEKLEQNRSRLLRDFELTEAESVRAAKICRSMLAESEPDTTEVKNARQQLMNAVQAAFDVQLALRETQLQLAENSLIQLKRKHARRKGLADQIIQRRMKALLDGDETSWLQTNAGTTDRTDVQDSVPTELSFEMLRIPVEGPSTDSGSRSRVPPSLVAHIGKQVHLRGKMLPGFMAKGITRFVLVNEPKASLSIDSDVEAIYVGVTLADGQEVSFSNQPIQVVGILELNEDPMAVAVERYRLRDARVTAVTMLKETEPVAVGPEIDPSLYGRWKLKSIAGPGIVTHERDIEIEINDRSYTLIRTYLGDKRYKMWARTDTRTTPPQILFSYDEGQSISQRSIYRVEGNTLKIASFGTGASGVPSDFDVQRSEVTTLERIVPLPDFETPQQLVDFMVKVGGAGGGDVQFDQYIQLLTEEEQKRFAGVLLTTISMMESVSGLVMLAPQMGGEVDPEAARGLAMMPQLSQLISKHTLANPPTQAKAMFDILRSRFQPMTMMLGAASAVPLTPVDEFSRQLRMASGILKDPVAFCKETMELLQAMDADSTNHWTGTTIEDWNIVVTGNTATAQQKPKPGDKKDSPPETIGLARIGNTWKITSLMSDRTLSALAQGPTISDSGDEDDKPSEEPQ